MTQLGIFENECFRHWLLVLIYPVHWLSMTFAKESLQESMMLRILRRRIQFCLKSQNLDKKIILSFNLFLNLKSNINAHFVNHIIKKIVNLIFLRFEESQPLILIFLTFLIPDTNLKSEFNFPKILIKSI